MSGLRLTGWIRQFLLAATQASMDSRTVLVTSCFGRKPSTVRAFSIEYRCAPDVVEGRVCVLGIDARDELVPRHELQAWLMPEVASHDFGVAAQRKRLHAHAVEALPGGRFGLVQACLMECRDVFGVHAVWSRRRGRAKAEPSRTRVDDPRVRLPAGPMGIHPGQDVSGMHDAGARDPALRSGTARWPAC